MSDLLNQASLVMVPSGYKEDTVYSAVPTDGSGDLSFTRASNGTRINSAGLVEDVAWNLLQYSEQIDNGVWTKFSPTSVTADTTTAPNGTATADTISTSATAVIRQSVTLNANETYTYSIYVKKISYDFFGFQSLISGTGVKSVFDLSNGTVTSQGSGQTASIESVGNGWYRCIITFNVGSSASNIFDLAADGGSATLRTFYAWGAQLNIGATAKPYFPTTDRLNVPRLTYQNGGGGCPSLLLEKQSTNLLTWSEQFDNAAWSKSNVTITANNTTSPDGTQNADLSTATAGGELLQGVVLSTSTSYTFSFYVKKGTASDAKYRVYNFDAGVNVVAPTSYISQTSTSDWVRVVVSFTTGATGTNYGIYLLDQTSAGTMYFYGAQVEASSYPTSYIPTTSSSATRVADACFKTGISSLIGQTEGTLFVDLVWNSPIIDVVPLDITGSDGKLIWMRGIGAQFYGNGTTLIANIGVNGAVQGTRYKIAFVYGANDFKLYRNGVLIGTDTSGTFTGSFSDLALNSVINQSNLFNQVCVFKTKLTDAELIALTTI